MGRDFEALVDDLRRRWEQWEGNAEKRAHLSARVLAAVGAVDGPGRNVVESDLQREARSAKTMQGLPDSDAAPIHIGDPVNGARHDAMTRLWQAIGILFERPMHLAFVPADRLAEYHAELDRFAALPALVELRKALS
jgi:hypothetical protein